MGYLRNRGTKAAPAWYIRYRDVDGRWKQRHSKQPSKEAARAVLAEAEARVRRGEMGIPEPTPEERGKTTITVAQLAARFVGDVEGEPGYRRPRIKDLKSYRADVRSHMSVRIGPALGSRPAAAVRLADIERLRDDLLARGLAPASVKQTLAILSKVYNWARRAGLLDCANPVSGVERPRPVPSLDYLSATEVGQLLATAEAQAARRAASWQDRALYPMAATAIYTGMRKGELFGLRWLDVHLDAARIDVMRSYRLAPKSGDQRHLPINEDLAPLLRAWRKVCPQTPDNCVFPVEGSPGRMRMGLPEDNVGLTELLAGAECHPPADGHPWHMLRHTFAAHAVMSGASLYAVQRLLGHGSAAMTQRYAHLAPNYLAGEVARMRFERPALAGVTEIAEGRRRRASKAERKR